MTKSCKVDLSGKKFGRYTVVKFVPNETRYSKYLCLCDCGVEKLQHSFDLTSGNVQSCGCLNKELSSARSRTHGQSGYKSTPRTREYRSWASMMDRCHWGGHKEMFKRYGAVGRTVCERWHKFENFLEDMGARPPNTSIERVNNDGNYEPENCIWADQKTQCLNTSRTLKVKYKNSIRKVMELCEELNVPITALRARARRRGKDYVLAFASYGIECDYVSSEMLNG